MQFQDRYFDISKPDTPGAVPLLIALHGGGGSGMQFAGQLKLGNLLKDKAVCAFPTATFNNGNPPVRAWNSNNPPPSFNNAPDSEYLKNFALYLKDILEGQGYTITEVYLVGQSNGGMMCYRLLIDHPEIFAGAFIISSDVMVSNPGMYTGRIKHIHGEIDENIPIAGGVGLGGVYYPPVLAKVQEFVQANNGNGIINGQDFVIVPNATHSMSSLDESLAVQDTTIAQLIYNFIFF